MALDKDKVAAKLAEKSAQAGGPPGKKKEPKTCPTHGKVLIPTKSGTQLVCPDKDCDYHETVETNGAATPPVKRIAVDGAAVKAAMKPKKVEETIDTPKKAKKKLAQIIGKAAPDEAAPVVATTTKKAEGNDAMQALVDGAAKKKLSKEERRAAAKRGVESAIPGIKKVLKADAEASQRDSEIAKSIMSLKVSTDEALKNALNAFIDGPIKEVLETFVTLYVSRKTDGDSDEAVLALDACRKAFDACGLLLVDVETKAKKPVKIEKATEKPAKAKKK